MIMICFDGEPDDDEYADDSDQRGLFLLQHQVYECLCMGVCVSECLFVNLCER